MFYAEAPSREIDPAPGEEPAEAWRWFTAEDLRAERDRLEPDVVEAGRRAIETVASQR